MTSQTISPNVLPLDIFISNRDLSTPTKTFYSATMIYLEHRNAVMSRLSHAHF